MNNLQIFVDADACPVIKQVEQTAKEHRLAVTLLCDTNHVLTSDYSNIKTISAGADAVDFALINLCGAGDIVVTQDYGVAAMALAKGAHVIHQSGRWYTNDNIDRLLAERHLVKTTRRASSRNHIKGPRKRIAGDDESFLQSFANLIGKVLAK